MKDANVMRGELSVSHGYRSVFGATWSSIVILNTPSLEQRAPLISRPTSGSARSTLTSAAKRPRPYAWIRSRPTARTPDKMAPLRLLAQTELTITDLCLSRCTRRDGDFVFASRTLHPRMKVQAPNIAAEWRENSTGVARLSVQHRRPSGRRQQTSMLGWLLDLAVSSANGIAVARRRSAGVRCTTNPS